MKKLTNYSFALLMGAIMFSACKEKTYEPENFVVVEENQVPNGTVTFTLSVHVIPSSEKGRVSGLSGATVTINNAGGIATVTTGADGIAVFSGLSEGDVSIYVSMTGYASINTEKNLAKDFNLTAGNDAAHTQFVNTEIDMPRLAATLKGKFGDDYNNDGYDITSAADFEGGVTIRVIYSNNQQPNVYSTTTDNVGNFTLSNLPESNGATISIHYIKNKEPFTGAGYNVDQTYSASRVMALPADIETNLGTNRISTW